MPIEKIKELILNLHMKMKKDDNNNSDSEINVNSIAKVFIGLIVFFIIVCYWHLICFIAVMLALGYICFKFKNEIKKAIFFVGTCFKIKNK